MGIIGMFPGGGGVHAASGTETFVGSSSGITSYTVSGLTFEPLHLMIYGEDNYEPDGIMYGYVMVMNGEKITLNPYDTTNKIYGDVALFDGGFTVGIPEVNRYNNTMHWMAFG